LSEQPGPGAPPERYPSVSAFYGAEEPLPKDEIDPRVREQIDTYLQEHPGGQERLIPLLHQVQEQLGYLPVPVQEYVADKLGMSPVQVFGVVSFYHFFTTTPRGRYQFKVCMGTACFVRNARRLMDLLCEELDVEVGGLSEDGLFNLEQVRCMGACGLAPAVMVDNHVHGNLTPAMLKKLVAELRSRAIRVQDREESTANGEEIL
jgi:NADH:ubiquinone oxidoreductase subunit E